MSPLVNIKNLSIGYSTNKVLIENINSQIDAGEKIALLGLNGCGKSTLLKTLKGEINAISGSIDIDGKSIKEIGAVSMAKKIASVDTKYMNPGQVSVEELVGFGRYPFTGRLHFLQDRDKEIIDHAIENIGIKHLKERYVEELSDGERQKVMLACAVAQDTPVLLLDEPTSHLDVRNKVAIMNLINRFSEKEGKAILFSTHDLGLAQNVASRIWLIHDNKLLDASTNDFVKNKLWKPLLEGIDEEVINWL
jgi:iron complex transport system ATP-binding protein